MYYYQFHIGDYVSHTQRLSLLEDLAYRRLLDEYYLHQRPLNSGVTSVARQIGMRDQEDEVKFVLESFFTLTDDGWVNARAEKQIADYKDKIEKASRAGKASAQQRFNGRSTDVQPTNNHKPITKNQEPIKKEKIEAPAGVTPETWAAFVQQRKAKKAQITQLVLDGIGRQAALASWTLEDALKEIVVRNWTSFDAEWVKGKKAPSHNFMRGLT